MITTSLKPDCNISLPPLQFEREYYPCFSYDGMRGFTGMIASGFELNDYMTTFLPLRRVKLDKQQKKKKKRKRKEKGHL